MDFGWEKLFKRYVWHDEKTPYFTRVAGLSRAQACYELRTYAVLMAVLFGAAALAALGPALPHANAAVVPLYAFSVCCAAVLLGCTRHPSAALWCAGAPFALLAYFGLWGFHPRLEPADKWVLVAVVLALAAYSPRVVAVARASQRLHG
jgi:hypothetical protein